MSQPSSPAPRPPSNRRWRKLSVPHWYWKAALILIPTIILAASFGNDAIFNVVQAIVHNVTTNSSTGGTPNTANPQTGTTSKIHLPSPVDTKPFTPAKTLQAINRPYTPAMKPMIINLDPTKSTHAISSDGTLEVTVPAGAITVADVANTADGSGSSYSTLKATVPTSTTTIADAYATNNTTSKLSLRVTQIAPGSGSNTGGGVVSFGTYQFEIIDNTTGKVVVQGLHKPAHVQFHLGKKTSVLDVSKAFATLNGAVPSGTHTTGGTAQLPVHFDQKNNTLVTDIPVDTNVQSTTTTSAKSGIGTQTVAPMVQTVPMAQVFPETVVSFNTYAPVAVFGGPAPLETNMNVGALTQGIKLDVPPGPAGTLPDLTLAYNSSAVNDQHSAQTTASWVGEGWNMSLGSISWSEHNVFSNTNNPT